MKYRDLSELLMHSPTGRAYFYTLPEDIRLELSLKGGSIHGSTELHSLARDAEQVRRREIMARRGRGENNMPDLGNTDTR